MRRLTILLLACVTSATSVVAAEEGDMLAVGSVFPEFSLTAHDGTTVSRADLAGNAYLLYFYPKADTPGCTREACELRDRWSDVEAAGFTVFGVSYDSPEDNRRFAEKFKLPFMLLSDQDRSLAAAVGAKRALLPVPKRISYLVGADGTVLKAYASVDPATHAGEVLTDFHRPTDS